MNANANSNINANANTHELKKFALTIEPQYETAELGRK